jgi:hypothetical protein
MNSLFFNGCENNRKGFAATQRIKMRNTLAEDAVSCEPVSAQNSR